MLTERCSCDIVASIKTENRRQKTEENNENIRLSENQSKNIKLSKLVGRIIFANFFSHSLEKYKSIIEEVESSPLFQKLSPDSTRNSEAPIIIKHLSKVRTVAYDDQLPHVIAEVQAVNGVFYIKYSYEGFNRKYIINRKKLNELKAEFSGDIARNVPTKPDENNEIDKLFHRLRRISYRNKATHEILKAVIKHQSRYLRFGNPLNLRKLSQVQLSNWLNSSNIKGNYIDNSVISRIIAGKSIITPFGLEIPLHFLFPSEKERNKRLIKEFLDKERQGLEMGEIKRPFSDREIKDKLKRTYRLTISRHSVCAYRRELGIPALYRRIYGYKYPPLSANFSSFYSLEPASVNNNAPCDSGIYELRLNNTEIKYPIGSTSIIYIGSAKNIKKRLKDHLTKDNKNSFIREFLQKHKCLFRYILVSKEWKEEEKRLYELFVTTYSSPPKCNRVSP